MEIITRSDIKKYYKIFGYVHFINSLLVVIFWTDINLKERIMGLIAINGAYHMPYLFFSSLSYDSSRMANNFNKVVGTGMLKLFSIFGIVCSCIMIYIFISTAISEKEYFGLYRICIAIGLFLGAYKLWTDLSNE